MSSFKDNSGLEEYKPKATQAERDEQMKKFLAKGGKVEKCPPGSAYIVGSLDKSKKPRYTREEIRSGKPLGTAPMPDLTSYKKGSYQDYDVGGNNLPEWFPQSKNPVGGK